MNKKYIFGAVAVGLLVTGVAVFALTRDDGQDSSNNDESAQVIEVVEPVSTGEATDTATYTVKLDTTWSEQTHPGTYPSGAHLSPMVVVSHSEVNDLFTAGAEATDGFQVVAETGATSGLVDELVANESVLNTEIGKRIDAPATDMITIELSQEASLLSLVSMLAPSPDWVVALSNVELFRDGNWIDGQTLNLTAFDAGTDSGEAYSAANSPTSPKGLISLPESGLLAEIDNTVGYGFVEITRTQ